MHACSSRKGEQRYARVCVVGHVLMGHVLMRRACVCTSHSLTLAKSLYLTGTADLAVAMLLTNKGAAFFQSFCDECSICYDPITVGPDNVVVVCLHVFHADCISMWQTQCRRQRSVFACPLCRARF